MARPDSTATNIGTGDANFNLPQFVDEVWSKRVLNKLYDKTIFMSKVNRDYEGEIKGKGDSVRVHEIGPITAKPYLIPTTRNATIANRAGGVVYELMTGDDMTLQITEADYYGFEVEDIEDFFATFKYMNQGASRAAEALALATDRWIMGQMYTASISDTADDLGRKGGTPATPHDVVTSTDYTTNTVYDKLVDLGIKMDDQLCEEEGRWIVVPTFVEGLLRKDNRFVGAGADGAGTVRDKGRLGDIAGFTVYKLARKTFSWYSGDTTGPDGQVALTHQITDALFVNGTSVNDVYYSVAGVNSAYTFVDALVKNERLRLQDGFADALRGLHVYGGKAMRPNHLFGIKCVDNIDTASNE